MEAVVHDVRAVLRLAEGCTRQPPGAVADSCTLQLTPESGPRAGGRLGHLLAWHVTAARAQERAQGGRLAAQVQAVTGDAVAAAFVDQGCTGD